MRILYVACGFDGGKSGISVYMRETLVRLARNHRVTVVATMCDRQFLPEHPNLRYHVLPQWCNPAVCNMLYVWLFLPWRFRRKDFDLLLLAAANRRACATRKWRTVAVVHDLSQYHVESKYDFFRTAYIKWLLPHLVRRSDVVVTACRASAVDLTRHWHVRPERIRIDYLGFDRQRFHLECDAAAVEAVRKKYGLDKPFLLYISRIEHPGKNHLRLMEAYEALPEQLRMQYDLVLGGAPWSRSEVVFDYWKKSPERDRIRLIGFVEFDELPALYHASALYVFPSLFEGFGLSLLEAMACGIPVACSENSSLGEVAGAAAELFDPGSVEAIRDAIARVLGSATRRGELIAAGLRRIELFSWEAYTARLAGYAHPAERHRVLGINYNNVTMATALELIAMALRRAERRKIAFVNADCFNRGWRMPEYRAALARFDYVFPDGSGVRMAGRMLGNPVVDNVNGTDLLPPLMALAREGDYRIFLLGARPGVAEKMRRNLVRDYPGLRIVGAMDGFRAEEEMIGAVNRVGADILLVALGVPRQELFIDRNFKELKCQVVLGVGGLFDFYSGNMPRAPHWLRRIGMEWIFRLLMEPRRMFRRYVIGNPLFIFRVWRYGENVR